MATATANKPKNQKANRGAGRPPIDRKGAPKPEVIAGQISGHEIKYVRDKITSLRGVSESHVVRRAVQLLIALDQGKKVDLDWSIGLDVPGAAGGVNDRK